MRRKDSTERVILGLHPLETHVLASIARKIVGQACDDLLCQRGAIDLIRAIPDLRPQRLNTGNPLLSQRVGGSEATLEALFFPSRQMGLPVHGFASAFLRIMPGHRPARRFWQRKMRFCFHDIPLKRYYAVVRTYLISFDLAGETAAFPAIIRYYS